MSVEEPPHPGMGPAADDGGPITGMDGEIVPEKTRVSLENWSLWVDEFLGVGLDVKEFSSAMKKVATFESIDEYRSNPDVTPYRTLNFGDITIPPPADAPAAEVSVPSVVKEADPALAKANMPSVGATDVDPLLAAALNVPANVPSSAQAISIDGVAGVRAVPPASASTTPAVTAASPAAATTTAPAGAGAMVSREGLYRTFHRKFNLRVFREGIEPSWEHPENAGGGRYVWSLQRFPPHLRGYPTGVQSKEEIAILFDEVVAVLLDPAMRKSAVPDVSNLGPEDKGGMVKDGTGSGAMGEGNSSRAGAAMASDGAEAEVDLPPLPPLPDVGDEAGMENYKAVQAERERLIAERAAAKAAADAVMPDRPARTAAEVAKLRKWRAALPKFGREVCGVVLHHGLARGLLIELWTMNIFDPRRLNFFRRCVLDNVPLSQIFKPHATAVTSNLVLGQMKKGTYNAGGAGGSGMGEGAADGIPSAPTQRVRLGDMAQEEQSAKRAPPKANPFANDPNAITWDDGIPADPMEAKKGASGAGEGAKGGAMDDGIPDAPEGA